MSEEVKYTEALTAEISAEYRASPSREIVDAISARIGKSPRSVIAKLSSEGVYLTPIRTTKTGDAIVKKEQLAQDIANWLKLGTLETLPKTGKQDLLRLHKALQERYANT